MFIGKRTPIYNVADVADAVECSTVNLAGFTVPAGQGLTLNLVTGATVNMSKYKRSFTLHCLMKFLPHTLYRSW